MSESKNTIPSAEVRSYIYQQLAEIEPFLPDAASIGVFAKDPSKKDENGEEVDIDQTETPAEFRIAFVVIENGKALTGEGRSNNIFEATNLAKLMLLRKLNAIKDSTLSAQDRNIQIEHAKNLKRLH